MMRPCASIAFACLLACSVPALAEPTLPAIPGAEIDATASSSFIPSITPPSLTIDGSGLAGDLHDSHPMGHTMWLSTSGGGGSAANNPAGLDGPAWLLYDLGREYVLDQAWIWNHNQENLTDRGLRFVTVSRSTDAIDWDTVAAMELSEAPGTAGYAHGDEVTFDEDRARYILLTAAAVDGNHGSAYFGLSEIRFYGEPAPITPSDYPIQVEEIGPDPLLDGLLDPQPVGWLGADAAHSIDLGDGRILWLFADTFVGTVTNGSRDGGAAFINNSLGVQDVSGGLPGSVSFHWGPGPSSIFPHVPGTPGSFYWPTMGALVRSELFLFSFAVETGGPLGFDIAGTVLHRIDNPQDPIGDWNVATSDFGIGDANFGVHSALYLSEPWLYFLGYEDTGGRRTILARMAVDDLVAGADAQALEFWAQQPAGAAWSSTPTDLVTLFRPGVTETGIQYIEEWDRFVVTTYDVFGPAVYLTTARELTGPWEEPVRIYSVPEHAEVSFDIISYAARPHPELSTQPGEVILTYATNSFGTIAPLFTPEGLGIYHPRFVRVQLSRSEPGSHWMLR